MAFPQDYNRPMSNLVDQWLDHLRTRNMSPNTIDTYRRTLRTLRDAEAATADDIDAWWTSRAHLAPASRVNELAALKSFYLWCRRRDHRGPTDDPTYRIEPPKVPKGLPRPVSRADLNRLLDTLPDDLRRAVCLGAWAGLRVSEVAALDWSDVDRETNRIRVTGKGQKTRLVGLSPLLLDALLPDTGGNVVTAGGRAYAPATLSRRVNRAMRAAGVESTFHALRHRFGTLALATSGNLLAVGRAMGHADPSSTAIYAATSDADLDVIAQGVVR